MNRFHNDCILAEKTMNTLPNGDKPSKNPIHKKAPLTKAYSRSDATSSSCAFITPREFVELVSQNSNAQDLPILDCRSQMDFGFGVQTPGL